MPDRDWKNLVTEVRQRSEHIGAVTVKPVILSFQSTLGATKQNGSLLCLVSKRRWLTPETVSGGKISRLFTAGNPSTLIVGSAESCAAPWTEPDAHEGVPTVVDDQAVRIGISFWLTNNGIRIIPDLLMNIALPAELPRHGFTTNVHLIVMIISPSVRSRDLRQAAQKLTKSTGL